MVGGDLRASVDHGHLGALPIGLARARVRILGARSKHGSRIWQRLHQMIGRDAIEEARYHPVAEGSDGWVGTRHSVDTCSFYTLIVRNDRSKGQDDESTDPRARRLTSPPYFS